ncbi:MAG: prepilin-type N-terminal cleavage/methylation domain-containing protein [Myxococcota bacterium]
MSANSANCNFPDLAKKKKIKKIQPLYCDFDKTREKQLLLSGYSTRSSGFTLIEIIIVMAIIGLMLGVVLFAFRFYPRMKLREASRKFSSAVRFTSSLARTNRLYHRLVLDLDASSPEVEIEMLPSDTRIPALDPEIKDEDEKEIIFEEWPRYDPADPTGPLGPDDLGKPFMPPEPEWTKPETRMAVKTKLETVRINRVFFPCINREYTEGKIGLVFGPDGNGQEVIVTIESDNGITSSLWIRQSSGQVKYLMAGEIPRDICIDAVGNDLRIEED